MVSQPEAPNPYATANAQTQQNQATSAYNTASGNANEVNPYGTVSYATTGQTPIYTNGQISGYAPNYTRTTTLSPDQQKLLGLETQSKYNMGTAGVEQSARLRDSLNQNQIDPSQWQPWQTGLKTQDIRQDQTPTDRPAIEKAMMDSYNRSVAPTEASQDAQMAARGLSPGSQGYGTMQMQRDDSRAEQARQAYIASGNESRAAENAYNTSATSKFNMDQALSSYYNNLRGAQSQEAYASRNQPINETTALMSGSQATIPQFQPFQGSQVASPNIAQYINDNYKAQSAAASQTNAGIFGLLGAGVKALPL